MLTFLVPAHDERASLAALVEEIRAAAARVGAPYEIVVVDDGSEDGTDAWLAEASSRAADLRFVRHPRRLGQSAALATGLLASRGDLLVTLDADLQNDPADVPALLAALDGADLVCGVRATRRDGVAKRLGSRVANAVRRVVLGDGFRDVGCSLKVWRREVAARVPRFEGFHRFLPLLAEAEGFRVVERPVSHRPRRHGRTHYGNLARALRGLYDLFGVRWLLRRRLPRG